MKNLKFIICISLLVHTLSINIESNEDEEKTEIIEIKSMKLSEDDQKACTAFSEDVSLILGTNYTTEFTITETINNVTLNNGEEEIKLSCSFLKTELECKATGTIPTGDYYVSVPNFEIKSGNVTFSFLGKNFTTEEDYIHVNENYLKIVKFEDFESTTLDFSKKEEYVAKITFDKEVSSVNIKAKSEDGEKVIDIDYEKDESLKTIKLKVNASIFDSKYGNKYELYYENACSKSESLTNFEIKNLGDKDIEIESAEFSMNQCAKVGEIEQITLKGEHSYEGTYKDIKEIKLYSEDGSTTIPLICQLSGTEEEIVITCQIDGPIETVKDGTYLIELKSDYPIYNYKISKFSLNKDEYKIYINQYHVSYVGNSTEEIIYKYTTDASEGEIEYEFASSPNKEHLRVSLYKGDESTCNLVCNRIYEKKLLCTLPNSILPSSQPADVYKIKLFNVCDKEENEKILTIKYVDINTIITLQDPEYQNVDNLCTNYIKGMEFILNYSPEFNFELKNPLLIKENSDLTIGVACNIAETNNYFRCLMQKEELTESELGIYKYRHPLEINEAGNYSVEGKYSENFIHFTSKSVVKPVNEGMKIEVDYKRVNTTTFDIEFNNLIVDKPEIRIDDTLECEIKEKNLSCTINYTDYHPGEYTGYVYDVCGNQRTNFTLNISDNDPIKQGSSNLVVGLICGIIALLIVILGTILIFRYRKTNSDLKDEIMKLN